MTVVVCFCFGCDLLFSVWVCLIVEFLILVFCFYTLLLIWGLLRGFVVFMVASLMSWFMWLFSVVSLVCSDLEGLDCVL